MIAGSGNWDEDERSWERSCRRTAEVEYDREFDGFEAFKSSLMTFGNVSSALLSPLTTYGNYSLARITSYEVNVPLAPLSLG